MASSGNVCSTSESDSNLQVIARLFHIISKRCSRLHYYLVLCSPPPTVLLCYFPLLCINRGEELLIYFATDDVKNLRPQATAHLSSIGRVVFGLLEDEVGHVSPYWTPQFEKAVYDRAEELHRELGHSTDAYLLPPKKESVDSGSFPRNGLVEGGAGDDYHKAGNEDGENSVRGVGDRMVSVEVDSKGEVNNPHLIHVEKTEEATLKHGNMAMVEW